MSPISEKIIKPLVRGRDIIKWTAKQTQNWLISTFPSLEIDLKEHSGIEEHFKFYGFGRLEQSGKPGARKKTSGKWFETQDSIAYWQEFEKPKIMYQKFQVKPCFIYDTNGLYCNDSMWIIPTDDKVLLGILNSKLGWWLISKYCTAIQNGYQLIWKYFSQVPIAKGTDQQRSEVEEKVNRILDLKKEDPTADVSNLEKDIDMLIYKMYNLSENDIHIIDSQ